MCRLLHEEYERAAIEEGWVTQAKSRVPWSDVPEANQRTMRRALHAVLMEVGVRFTTKEA